jgi:hypothetical protein
MAFGRPPAGLGFTSSAHRLRGYRQALTAAGLEVRADLIGAARMTPPPRRNSPPSC